MIQACFAYLEHLQRSIFSSPFITAHAILKFMLEPITVFSKSDLQQRIQEAVLAKGARCDLSHIDVSKIKDMSSLFAHSSFKGSVAKWDVSNVENMNGMFLDSAFDGDISSWNVLNVQTMRRMFSNSIFQGDLSLWNLSRVGDVQYMFENSAFHGDLSSCTLRYHGSFKGMVDPDFKGVLPKVGPVKERAKLYGILLGGGLAALAAYCKRVSFNTVHADVLLSDIEKKPAWIKKKEHELFKSVHQIAMSVGLNEQDTRMHVVKYFSQSKDLSQILPIEKSFFENPFSLLP